MYDPPTAADLLEAARQHLEDHIVPLTRQTDRQLYFQTLVAVNVLRIVERELTHRDDHLHAAWARLNMLFGNTPLPKGPGAMPQALADRNALLCQAIRAGKFDDDRAFFEHLKATAIEQLEVANPGFLAALQAEDEAS